MTQIQGNAFISLLSGQHKEWKWTGRGVASLWTQQRQGDLCKFQTSLTYRTSSRAAKATIMRYVSDIWAGNKVHGAVWEQGQGVSLSLRSSHPSNIWKLWFFSKPGNLSFYEGFIHRQDGQATAWLSLASWSSTGGRWEGSFNSDLKASRTQLPSPKLIYKALSSYPWRCPQTH